MYWINKIFSKNKEKKENKQCNIPNLNKSVTIPKGWYVHEAGQNPLHMLWFVVLINFDDVVNNIENPRHFVVEEKNSYEDALKECITNIN